MGNEKESDSTSVRGGNTIAEKNADATLRFIEENEDKVPPLTAEGEKKLLRKLYLRLVVLISAMNIMLFVSGPIYG